MSAGKRNFGLDMLRAAAILGVFLYHGLTLRMAHFDLLAGLGTGVELFFVLSGFLIGRICIRSLRKGSFSFWNFWRSRWWRTLPPYVATILLYLAMERFFPAPPLNWHYAFFLQNYTGAVGFGPSWTLCVEEHFYLFLPVILAPAVYFGGVRVLRWLLPVLCFTPLLLRFGWYFTAGMPNKWFRFSHFHADGLIAGVWLAYLFVEQPELFARLRRPAKWLLPLVPIMIFFIPQWEPHPVFADLFLCGAWALGYLPWLVYAYGIEWHPATKAGRLLHWAITGTALCSYSVYLTHTIFDPAIRSGILGSWHRSVGKSLIVLTFTFLGGVIFYFLVERPSIVTRDRYLKARTETPVPVTAAVS